MQNIPNNRNSHKIALRVLTAFFSQILIFVAIVAAGQFVFATNDDTTMVAIASGGYGSPSEFVINLHLVLGWILKFLFTICADLNWITVLFLGTIYLSVFILDLVFANKIHSNVSFFSVIIIIDILTAIVLSYFSFTVVAYWSGIAGLIAVSFVKRKEHIGITIGGWLLIVLAALIRGEAFKSILIVYSAVVVTELVLHKNKVPLFITIVVAMIMFIAIESNTWLSNLNPVQEEFLIWGETRSAALDCAVVPWDEAKFTEEGISGYQYHAIYNAFYFCYDAIDLDVMESLIELNSVTNKYNFDVIQFFINHFTIGFSFEMLYRVVFAACALFYFVMGCKRDRITVIAIYLMTLASEFVFYFIQRGLYRVVMPNYLLAILLILLYCQVDPVKVNKIKELGLSGTKILIFLSVSLMLLGGYLRMEKYDFSPYLYSQERKEVLQYIADHPDTIYMCGNASVFSLPVADSPWDIPAKGSYWNLIGNWETYSVPYLALMNDHNVEDPYNVLGEAINNDNILILSNEGDSYPETHWWVMDLIRQYYGKNCAFEKVEDIGENYVNETYSEQWAVYRIVEQYG